MLCTKSAIITRKGSSSVAVVVGAVVVVVAVWTARTDLTRKCCSAISPSATYNAINTHLGPVKSPQSDASFMNCCVLAVLVVVVDGAACCVRERVPGGGANNTGPLLSAASLCCDTGVLVLDCNRALVTRVKHRSARDRARAYLQVDVNGLALGDGEVELGLRGPVLASLLCLLQLTQVLLVISEGGIEVKRFVALSEAEANEGTAPLSVLEREHKVATAVLHWLHTAICRHALREHVAYNHVVSAWVKSEVSNILQSGNLVIG